MIGRLAAAGAVLVVLAAAGCTGGAGTTATTAATPTTPTNAPAAASSSTTPSTTTTSAGSTATTAGGSLEGFTVVIDPGHNGANGSHVSEISRLVDAGGFQKACNTVGTSEGGLTESRFNWLTALRVKSLLEARGAKVVLTRTSDDGWGPCVDQRGLEAERAGADVLVSIHADGAAPGAHGFHVIRPVPGPTVTDPRSEASAQLAGEVRDALVTEGLVPSTYAGTDGIAPRNDIATVNRSTAPAVMVESGNMHNPGDFGVLDSEAGRERIAQGLVDGITSFLVSSG